MNFSKNLNEFFQESKKPKKEKNKTLSASNLSVTSTLLKATYKLLIILFSSILILLSSNRPTHSFSQSLKITQHPSATSHLHTLPLRLLQ